jgi:hypothetical protein
VHKAVLKLGPGASALHEPKMTDRDVSLSRKALESVWRRLLQFAAPDALGLVASSPESERSTAAAFPSDDAAALSSSRPPTSSSSLLQTSATATDENPWVDCVRPGDLIITYTPGVYYRLFRLATAHSHDHVGGECVCVF